MTPGEINLICDRLDRIEDKLDESIKCQGNKVSRDECGGHRNRIWERLDSISVKVWIAVGIGIAVQLVVLPMIVWLLTRG